MDSKSNQKHRERDAQEYLAGLEQSMVGLGRARRNAPDDDIEDSLEECTVFVGDLMDKHVKGER